MHQIWDILLDNTLVENSDSSSLCKQHAPFYTQKILVRKNFMYNNRHDIFAKICEDQRVLHVGCTDYPFCNAQDGHLHIYLDKYAKHLDGFDVDEEGFKILKPKVRGDFYSKWDDVYKNTYDVIIATEVLEHVGNVQDFLESLNKVDAKYLFISIPDAYSCRNGHFEYLDETQTFIEIVHSDHNAWYSPFTLKNVVHKYSDWKMVSSWFFYGRSILSLFAKTKQGL
jgi:hypothetical protein